jgi:CO/xanthine dehydrogenase Mo-binding subunit
MENPGFLDYRIPVASDLPMIEPVMVEVPNPDHPYGAKGVAEVNICPPMAAIANAIERAVGMRLTELPMSPPKVLAAIDSRGQKEKKGTGRSTRGRRRGSRRANTGQRRHG